MQYSFVAVAAGLLATANAAVLAVTPTPVISAYIPSYPSSSPVAYTTEVVTALTTYCPYATSLTHNGKTYTVTSATTLTITDCPCTITHSTVPTAVPSVVPGTSVPVVSPIVSSSAPVVTPSVYVPVPVSSVKPSAVASTTVTYKPTPTGTAKPTQYTGAATNVKASVGALAGIAGLMAFVL